MAISKKQKYFINNNYKSMSIDLMQKHLQIDLSELQDYIDRLQSKQNENKKVPTSKIEKIFKNPYLVPVLLTLLILIIGIICFDTKLYISGDNIEFIQLSTVLANEHHYSDHIKYPPEFPLLLAGSELIAPGSILAKKIVVFLLFIVMVPFLYKLFCYYVSQRIALVLTFLSATSSTVIEFSHYVMSELPYLSVSIISLYLVHRWQKNSEKKYLYFLSFFAFSAPFYMRTIGLALLPAATAIPLLQKKWKSTAITFCACFVIMLPWLIRSKVISIGGGDYTSIFSMVNPYDPSLGTLTLSTLIERIMANLNIYFLRYIPLVIFPLRFETTMHHSIEFSKGISLFLSFLFIGGIAVHFFKKRDILSLYMIFYMGILILWPQVWSGGRFLVPVIPFLLYFFLYAVKEIGALLSRFMYNKSEQVLICGLLSILALFNMNNILRYQQFMENYPPEWGNYFKAAEWVRDNTPENIKIADRKPGLFGTTAEREATSFLRSADPVQLINRLAEDSIDYVILSSIPYGDYARFLLPACQTYQDKFIPVYSTEEPPTYVLKFDKIPIP